VIWQLGSRSGVITERVLPAPGLIARAALETYRDGSLADALQISAQRVTIGFVIGAAAGLVLGVLVGLSKFLDHVVDPPLQMIRTIPFLGLIPLFILWFGIGETPKIAMVALGVSFPLYLNASAAIRHVDPKLVETAQVLRFTPWQRISVVVVPSTLPQVLVGLRQSLGIAWLSLIVAEQINADAGLGYLINNANQSLRTDIVVFGLILYALLGLTTDGVVRLLEKRALRWRPAVAR
jgi:sulfonate transport system permease protein